MVTESRSNQSDRVSDRSDAVHLGISLLHRYHLYAVYAGRSFIISSCREDGIKKEENSVLILSAFLIFIGGQIRMTAVFPLIAICMFLFIKYPVKSFLKRFAFIVIGLFCAMILISSMLNTYGVKDRRYEYPVTHWLKLGLSENGMYTTEDNNTTKAQDSYEKR